jgi:hypothetical protein
MKKHEPTIPDESCQGVYLTQGSQGNRSPLEPFVDAVRAGNFLNIRPRRVLELARTGEIPGHPLGSGQRRVWRFRLSELAMALTSHPVNSLRQSPAPRQETT